MKKILLGILIIFGMLSFGKKVWAYDLTLTSVGALSTLGVNYSVVNYTGGIPRLSGTASPSATVGVNINTILGYTTASTSGIWQFTPASLTQGDNIIAVTSGIQSIAFNLRFNATPSATVTVQATSSAELLDTGVWEYYIPAIAAGLGVFFLGKFGKRRMQKWEKGG